MLIAARRDVIELLQPSFAERAGELGLAGRLARLRRRAPDDHRSSRSGSPATSSGERPAPARTSTRSAIRCGDRDLRTFGSQGEQRLAVLALLLAEAELIGERRRVPPLLLLDDALSELDESRRRTLSERIGAVGQTIVTATGAEALPLAPAQLLAGHARPRRARPDGAPRRRRPRRPARRGRSGRRRPRRRDAALARASSATRSRAPSWPQRIARDGTLLVAAVSSTWAFELGLLADDILAKLAAAIGEGAPTAIRFAPGPVPAPPAPLPAEAATAPPEVDDATRLLAEQLTSGMSDDGAPRDDRARRRREPRQGRFQPPFLIHCR